MFNSVWGTTAPSRKAWSRHEKDPGPKHPGPPRTRDPQENHRRDNRSLTQKRAEESPKVTSDSHSVDAPGCRGGKPAGSTGSRTTHRADRPWARRPKAPHPPIGPSKASRARPRQATAESGPALTRASRPGARNHQPPAASSTGRAWWCGGGRLRWWWGGV